MKKLIVLSIFLWSASCVQAQSNDERAVIEKTYLLSHTVFGTKDSLTLESLFAPQATYGHSHGNLQTRSEAIAGISRNRSKYTDTSIAAIKVIILDKTAVVRYLFRANENKIDGTVTQLNFSMMLVWVKQKHTWKLVGRQAVSLDK